MKERNRRICLGLQFLRSANSRILEVLVPKFAYDFIRSIFWLNFLFSFVEILSSILNYFVGKIFDKVDIRKALAFDSAFDSAVLVLFPYAKSKIFVSSLVIARRAFSPLKIGLKTIYTKLGFSSQKDLTYFSYTRSLGRTIASLSIFFLLYLLSYKLVFYISAALLIISIFLIAKLPNVNLKIKKPKIKLKTRKVLKKKWRYIAISSLQNFHYGLLYFPAIIIFMTEVLHFSLQFVYLIYGLGTLFALPFFKLSYKRNHLSAILLLMALFTLLYLSPLYNKEFGVYLFIVSWISISILFYPYYGLINSLYIEGIPKHKQGEYWGVLRPFSSISSFLGTLMGGIIASISFKLLILSSSFVLFLTWVISVIPSYREDMRRKI